jgi:hypothetical protein
LGFWLNFELFEDSPCNHLVERDGLSAVPPLLYRQKDDLKNRLNQVFIQSLDFDQRGLKNDFGYSSLTFGNFYFDVN